MQVFQKLSKDSQYLIIGYAGLRYLFGSKWMELH